MNPKGSFGVHTLRCAGLFDLPIPLRFASELESHNNFFKDRLHVWK